LRIGVSDLWRLDGRLERGSYALIGCVLFAIKHNLDRFVATFFFRRPWDVFSYLKGPEAGAPGLADSTQIPFYVTMVLLALPFIWTGIALTIRRLRDADWPVGLMLFFFVPFLNLAFFLLLSLVPSRAETVPKERHGTLLGRFIPESAAGSAAMSVLLTGLLAVPVVLLSINVWQRYGAGLFVGLPFALGFASAILYGYHQPRSWGSCVGVAAMGTALLCAFLVATAVEGVVCIAMASPIMLGLALLGATAGYFVQRRGLPPQAATGAVALALALAPLLMGAEHALDPSAPMYEVRSSVEIAAPPERVWDSVVSFSDIPAPTEWLFRAGIAYPLRATIDGRGVGAVRHCVFTTGPFVEPIAVWDEPHRLAFDVVSLPPPMQEWTPYKNVAPPHLKGFLTAEHGEFLLTPLPGGRTRLTGTTWYRHHMWPAPYWRLWSDYIIHEIHLRVLRHIQHEVESARPA
jgi:uncharacterized membrane protein YhaH (DUF805 family)